MVLSGLFRWAGFIATDNPCRFVKKPPVSNERVRYLSTDEHQRLIAVVSESSRPQYLRPIIVLAINTGLRRSNLLNLRWREIDFNAKVVRVQRTKNSDAHGLSLNMSALEAFVQMHELTENYDFVFAFRSGVREGIPIKDVKTTFNRAVRDAGIEDFHFHDMHHTFGSWLAMRDVPLHAIQKLMGHRRIQQTMRYAHLSPSYQRKQVELLDLGPPEETNGTNE